MLLGFVKHVEQSPYLEPTWIKRVNLEIWAREGHQSDCEPALRMLPKKLPQVKELGVTFRDGSTVDTEVLKRAHEILDDLSRKTAIAIVIYS